MPKTLNTWTLTGLIVGPILGSGVILLPPLAYAALGPQSVWAWLVILAFGGAFAAVFIRMTLRTHSDSGIASLIARERGPAWGALASNYLTGAVVFGVVPVLLTAAQLWPEAWSLGLPAWLWAAAFLAVTVGLLLAGLTTVSRLTFVLSSLTAVLLVAGAAAGLSRHPAPWAAPDPLAPHFGPTLLLLFWAIVGWEVVANYSKEVRTPEKTVPRAGALALALVSVVYLAVVLAIQAAAGPTHPPSMILVLEPLLGSEAGVIAGLLATGLCLSTLLMFTGAVTRMTAQRARDGELPRWLGRGQATAPPRVPIAVLASTSSIILGVYAAGGVDLAFLVSTANVFFLGNALLGLVASWTVLRDFMSRTFVVVLVAGFVALMAQSHPVGWILVGVVSIATFAARKRA